VLRASASEMDESCVIEDVEVTSGRSTFLNLRIN